MSVPEVPARPRRPWRKLVLGIMLLLPVLVLVGAWFYLRAIATAELDRAVAQADQLDPRWRLEELLARRAEMPPEQNSALVVQDAYRALPVKFLDPGVVMRDEHGEPLLRGAALLNSLDLTEDPPRQVTPEQAAGLRAELADVSTALAAARRLANLPRGRYELTIAPVFIETRLAHAEHARSVARLLQLDAVARAHEGDLDGAVDSCRALLNVGRSLGDEPFLISQLVRMAVDGVTCEVLQHVLAQGEPAPQSLEPMQALLADEASQPLLLWGMRGERAGMFDQFGKLASGALSLNNLGNTDVPSEGKFWRQLLGATFFRYNQGLCLKFMNEAVEIAKQPDWEQTPLFNTWEVQTREPGGKLARLAGSLTYLLMPAVRQVGTAQPRVRARLRSLEALLAVERYRRARGHWPERLDQAVPEFLGRIPRDPYRNQPLNYKVEKESVAVYSVGPDGVDDGGYIPPRPSDQPGTDLGYRLWNVDRRRQPPPPPPAQTPSAADEEKPAPEPEPVPKSP